MEDNIHAHVDREELTAADLARLDQNWSHANAEADRLVELIRAHRDEGCPACSCGSDEFLVRYAALKTHHLSLILRAALERFADQPQPAPTPRQETPRGDHVR